MPPTTTSSSVKFIAYLLNVIFIILGGCLLVAVAFAAINPPKQDISPARVSSYPQYFLSLLLISSYSLCLFGLSVLGIISLCFLNSFLMSLHILGQVAMVTAQLIAIAFTVTVRKRVHHKLEESWMGNSNCMTSGVGCIPVSRFLQSETMLIINLCLFLLLQIIHLIASSYLCEKTSYQERCKLIEESQREEEEEEDY